MGHDPRRTDDSPSIAQRSHDRVVKASADTSHPAAGGLDLWRMPDPPCDGCGSVTGLRWAGGSEVHDQYRCVECGCRVFVAR